MRLRRRRLAFAMLVLCAVAASGCARAGTVAHDGGGVAAPQPAATGNPEDALAAWKDFPVDRHPRPIVLVDASTVRLAGYTTGEAKMAAVSGSYRLDVPLPPGPPAAPVTLPDGAATLPLIGAAAAIDRMKADAGAATKDANVAPLAIIGIEFGTADFPTDRGTLALPVWRVHTADELGPTVVLAVADAALARPAGADTRTAPPGQRSVSAATRGADGRRLTLTVPEAEPHCAGEPIYKRTAGVLESGSAVVVTLTATRIGTVPGDPGAPCPLYLRQQPVTHQVDLAAPLGDRVLVDAQANPVPVTNG